MARAALRNATVDDLEALVRHRRGMWAETSDTPSAELDALDREYRRWARTRLRSGRLVGFIVEAADGHLAASGCLWLMPSQPRVRWRGLLVPYLMAMYTEKADRGQGHATRIVREAVRWSRVHGYPMLVLHASKPGRGIYEREGFAPTTEMRLRLDGPARAPRRRRRRAASRRTPRRRGPHGGRPPDHASLQI